MPDTAPALSMRGLDAAARDAVAAATARAAAEDWVRRIWDRDASLWSADAAVQEAIGRRLGWLDLPADFQERVAELIGLADGLRAEGCRRALVCGMGGSSLAPWVIARVWPADADGIGVAVLDSTDPQAVEAATAAGDPGTTLYVIASKSGTTVESASFEAYFWDLETRRYGRFPSEAAGEHFAVITDPGHSLDQFRHREAYRTVLLNPPDVGGRYSALTYVGLAPGALQGVDLEPLLDEALAMAQACRLPGPDDPGLGLGAALGALGRLGRDKVTFAIEPGSAPFGAWVEQLIAESTGKQGTGLVPIVDEPLGPPAVYTDDRVFVRLAPPPPGGDAAWRTTSDAALEALAAAGHPVLDVAMPGGLGAEFFRWEFATAVAGAVLGVNPFDEPNVTESKQNTARLLEVFRREGALPDAGAPTATEGPLALFADGSAAAGAAAVLKAHLARLGPHGYLALQAFIASTPERDAALAGIRQRLRDATRRATTVGYGPRFLHSTGQLHKGGPATGCFIQLTADHPADLPIPGAPETFGTLIGAQAAGDLGALRAHGLPALRIHLGADPDAGLEALGRLVTAATAA
ncbi:MAG TPA: hypothetical protein VMH24_00010 [Candidatus Sulfotelmatobacter sp.]|nr:hypothetical protein [Candidatus Sulfotelmatobacter sp.]